MPRPPRAPIDERLARIVCCVSDGYSLVACCCKLIMECSNKLCADFLLKLWKERMLVGSTLFSLIVNATVYVIVATAEEASLLLLLLHYIMLLLLLCLLPANVVVALSAACALFAVGAPLCSLRSVAAVACCSARCARHARCAGSARHASLPLIALNRCH